MKYVLCAVCAALSAVGSVTAADMPNVVMIISDDQAWNDFGFMGHPEIKTPHLDRLAAESATFGRGYVPSSLCRPSLMTMITGQYPHAHGITGNDPPKGTDRNELLQYVRRAPTLPKLLATKGYRSFQSGKWWEGNPGEGGFTAGMTHGDTTRGGRHGDVGLTIGRKGMQPIYDFIEESEDPFFLWYAPFLPHSPHTPPQRLLDKYKAPGKSIHVARYQAMCEWFDETCGELLNYLDKKGLSENTIVLFVTDNGWIQQETTPKYAPKSKRSPYDGGIRTPIMVRWPGHVTPGRYDTLVNSIDLAPTVLKATGIDVPESMPGIDLIEVANNDGRTDRKMIFGEIFEHDMADVNLPTQTLMYRWGIEGNWKLILPAAAGEPVELFQLDDDPFETTNLATGHPDVVQSLRAKIDAWWQPQK